MGEPDSGGIHRSKSLREGRDKVRGNVDDKPRRGAGRLRGRDSFKSVRNTK